MSFPYVLLVTGSRHHTDFETIAETIEQVLDGVTAHQIHIRHGACPEGADAITAEWCQVITAYFEQRGRVLVEDAMPADWDHCAPDCPPLPHRVPKKPGDVLHPGVEADYCPAAGPRRNTHMTLKEPRPALCLAFPLKRSYGTWNCMKAAGRAGIPVRRYTA